MDLKEKIEVIKSAAEEKLATDIDVLDIRERNGICDYFIIMSGSSPRQVETIADYIEEQMDKQGEELLHEEGKNTNRWIILDYNEVIVHVFHNEEREYYNLERLWTDSQTLREGKK